MSNTIATAAAQTDTRFFVIDQNTAVVGDSAAALLVEHVQRGCVIATQFDENGRRGESGMHASVRDAIRFAEAWLTVDGQIKRSLPMQSPEGGRRYSRAVKVAYSRKVA